MWILLNIIYTINIILITAKDVGERIHGKILESGNTRLIVCKYWHFQNCIVHQQELMDRRKLKKEV